jgi:hypothetical protein
MSDEPPPAQRLTMTFDRLAAVRVEQFLLLLALFALQAAAVGL